MDTDHQHFSPRRRLAICAALVVASWSLVGVVAEVARLLMR